MKIFVILSLCASVPHLHGYAPQEKLLSAPAYAASLVSLEKKSDGQRYSKVLALKGSQAFDTFVIKASWKKPVVLAVYAFAKDEPSSASLQLQQEYQNAAESFPVKDKVVFASLDISDGATHGEENKKLLAFIMQQTNVTSISLPLIFFFKDGQLYAPTHMPAIALAGYRSQADLCHCIQQKFFADPALDLPALKPDLTITPTQSLVGGRKKEPTTSSIWTRIKQKFSNKR